MLHTYPGLKERPQGLPLNPFAPSLTPKPPALPIPNNTDNTHTPYGTARLKVLPDIVFFSVSTSGIARFSTGVCRPPTRTNDE